MAPDMVHMLVVVALQVQPVVVVVVVVVVHQILVLVFSAKKVGVVMKQMAVAIELAQEKMAMKMEITKETPFQTHHILHHLISPHLIPFSSSMQFHCCIDTYTQLPMLQPSPYQSEFVPPVQPPKHDIHQPDLWTYCSPVVPTE
jgi:hypothetical protein